MSDRVGIRVVPPDEATGPLADLYERVSARDGAVDNIMQAHSLRPHTMRGHMELYKATLHHPRNLTPRWFLETLGVFVSALNGCAYCVDHHSAGLDRLVGEARGAELRAAAERDAFDDVLDAKERAAIDYARTLTRDPGSMGPEAIDALRAAGYGDGEILEIDQVVAYFAYANRTVLGLAVQTTGDTLGTSPSGDGWTHL